MYEGTVESSMTLLSLVLALFKGALFSFVSGLGTHYEGRATLTANEGGCNTGRLDDQGRSKPVSGRQQGRVSQGTTNGLTGSDRLQLDLFSGMNMAAHPRLQIARRLPGVEDAGPSVRLAVPFRVLASGAG